MTWAFGDLSPGDEITIRVLGPGEFDEPLHKVNGSVEINQKKILRKVSSVRDHLTFFREFRQRFKTTGAIAPSSRFLASAMTGPMKKILRRPDAPPQRILEIGPGTGAVTRSIVKLLRPQDRFDLVELNETFAEAVESSGSGRIRIISGSASSPRCTFCRFRSSRPRHPMISSFPGLPLNNFSPKMVCEIFESYFKLLAPGGTLSYFEYMYVRSIRKRVGRRRRKTAHEIAR